MSAIRIISLLAPLVVYIVTDYAHSSYYPSYGYAPREVGDFTYIIIPAVMSAVFPFGVFIQQAGSNAIMPRVFAFSGGALSIFWIGTALMVMGKQLEYTHAAPDEQVQLSIVIAIVGAVAGAIYHSVYAKKQ